MTNEKSIATVGDENIIASLVINGDLSKLTPNDKVLYYKKYCERLGLDPLTQPFKLLRLNGRETLYCDRSGTQQLSKLHSVSHKITSREVVQNCYVVTAQASTPDGRHTESIGAVNIENLKGDNLCNAMMKGETKAKRRATLDLLGLGVLDETELDTIPHAQSVDIIPNESQPKGNPFKQRYQKAEEVLNALDSAASVQDIANLYYVNAEMVEGNEDLKSKFTDKKNQFYSGASPETKRAEKMIALADSADALEMIRDDVRQYAPAAFDARMRELQKK